MAASIVDGGAARRRASSFLKGGGVHGAGRVLREGAMPAAALAVILGLLAQPAGATVPIEYEEHSTVPVIANNIFPFENPSETYRYYSLPFCKADKRGKERQGFGELLLGDRKESTEYDIRFRENINFRELSCEEDLESGHLKMLSDAIREDYYFDFFVGDIPVTGPIGRYDGFPISSFHALMTTSPKVLLRTHLAFMIGYNGKHIVSAKVEDSTAGIDPVDITDTSTSMPIKWSYSVEWFEDQTPYKDRIAHARLFPHEGFEIHWASILNSLVLVVTLTVFLAAILLRVIRNDFSRYMDVDEDDIAEEESGWKLIHGDVFRFPGQLNLFAAMNGAGAQLCLVTLMLLGCALFGVFNPLKRGSSLTCAFVLYNMTAWVGGLMSARLYRQLGGRNWVWNSVTASLVFPGPLLLVFSVVNSIAWHQSSTVAIPAYTVVVIVGMFVFITFPLTVIGAIIGRNTTSDFEAPCRTTRVPRQVPKDIPWYRRHQAQMFVSGFLPFTAIYIELHYIFGSVWRRQVYTMFGILILAFILVIMVCSLITVALVYFQLGREDHRWWWRSFCFGGSTGLFVYAFSFFYFFHRSNMHGLLQSAIYFGYTAVISYAFFVMLGYVGFASSLTFVKRIYSVLKCD